MAILNQSELEALMASRFADNVSGDIVPADIRNHFQDHLDSLQEYGGVMAGGAVSDVDAGDATPLKAEIFSTNATSANDMLVADQANNLIKVFEPSLYRVTLRLEAQWAATEDLTLLVYVNGAPSALTPFAFTQTGAGAANPLAMSFTSVALIVQAADIAAGPGGTHAEIELFFGSATGDFTVDEVNLSTFGLASNPLSIRTVG